MFAHRRASIGALAFSHLFVIWSVQAGDIAEYNTCKVGPIDDDDEIQEVEVTKFAETTNYKITTKTTTPGSSPYSSLRTSRPTQQRFTIEVTDENVHFEGFFIHVTSTNKNISPGRLSLTGSSKSAIRKNIRQLRCNKPSDAIRSRGANRHNKIVQVAFDWSGTCTDSTLFQIFIAPKVSSVSKAALRMNPTLQKKGDLWYLAQIDCLTARTILGDGVNLKSAFSKNDNQIALEAENKDDVSMKGNIYRDTFKPRKTSDARFDSKKSQSVTNLSGTGKQDKTSEKVPNRSTYERPSWAAWSTYSDCSASCDYGTMERRRLCISHTGQKLSSKSCPGNAVQTVKCIVSKCPEWSEWRPYTACSKTCGDGVKTRTRVCLSGTDDACQGPKNQTIECNIRDCPNAVAESKMPFKGSCEDRYSFCGHWQRKGYCDHRFTKWMSINCPVACSKCTKVKEDCNDRYPISCPRWSKQNRCQHRDVFLREYIKRNCKLSCNLC